MGGGIVKSRNPDRVADTQQRQIDEFMRTFGVIPLLDGKLVENLSLGATPDVDFSVSHGLGRKVRGYIVTSSTVALRAYLSPSANPTPDRQVILRANYSSGSPVASFWFF